MNGTLNYLSVVSFSEAVLMVIRDKDKKIHDECTNAINLCSKALVLQKYNMTTKNITKIIKKHKDFEDTIGEDEQINTLLCFILLVIEDVKNLIKRDERHTILSELINQVSRICIYEKIDKDLDQFEDYENAEKLNKIWRGI